MGILEDELRQLSSVVGKDSTNAMFHNADMLKRRWMREMCERGALARRHICPPSITSL